MIPPRAGNLADRLAKMTDADAFADELFVSVLSRRPTADERQGRGRRADDRRRIAPTAIAELIWALVASAEFRFNH